jgi:excisionase family DNA binding protein
MPSESRPRVYTVPGACRELGCGKSKLYEMIGEGAIDARKSGGTTLILAESIDRYLSTLPPADIRTRPRKDLRNPAAQAASAHQ